MLQGSSPLKPTINLPLAPPAHPEGGSDGAQLADVRQQLDAVSLTEFEVHSRGKELCKHIREHARLGGMEVPEGFGRVF